MSTGSYTPNNILMNISVSRFTGKWTYWMFSMLFLRLNFIRMRKISFKSINYSQSKIIMNLELLWNVEVLHAIKLKKEGNSLFIMELLI